VGDYDYLPYAIQNDPGYAPPPINFNTMMRQYGQWVSVSYFGRAWRPWASSGWRPYTYGHWIYTEYGPYWEGYEPWAWVGYHYGSWIFDRRYGWVWIPGYDWHPGRVAWAHGYGTIGWMPLPPAGHDYRRGHLTYAGGYNQFSYSDNAFGQNYGYDSYSYGGPYYDPRAHDMFYNPAYAAISVNLWVFIEGSDFGQDNYAGYDLGPDYTRYAFDQRTLSISNRPMEQQVLEQIVRQQVQRVPVEMREIQADKRPIKVVVPTGNASAERIRRQSPQVVRQVIAPAFAQEQKRFKGNESKVQAPVSKIFQQENVQPRITTRSRTQVIDDAREAQKNREQKQIQAVERAKQRTEQLKREGKIKEPGRNTGQPVQNPSDYRSVGGREAVQQNAPGRPVIAGPAPAPRPMSNNAANMPPASAQPAPPTPAAVSQQPHPVNQGATPHPVGAGSSPVVAPGKTGGMNNTDAAITNLAMTKIRESLPKIAAGVSIQTKNGIATVSGRVNSTAEANSVIGLVSGIGGVKSVKNKLSVKPARSQ